MLALFWAAAPIYWLAVGFLCLAGFLELSFNTMAQSLVQLKAPLDQRGRVIGIHGSLALSALAAMTIAATLLLFTRRRAVE